MKVSWGPMVWMTLARCEFLLEHSTVVSQPVWAQNRSICQVSAMDRCNVPLSIRALALEPPRASLLMRFPTALRLADGLGIGWAATAARPKLHEVDHGSAIPRGPSGLPKEISTPGN